MVCCLLGLCNVGNAVCLFGLFAGLSAAGFGIFVFYGVLVFFSGLCFDWFLVVCVLWCELRVYDLMWGWYNTDK